MSEIWNFGDQAGAEHSYGALGAKLRVFDGE
jgi:hypothetical protein